MVSKDEGETEAKKKGGVHVPVDWPWQDAKKLFEKPDVLPADEVEVITSYCASWSLVVDVGFQLDWKAPDVEGLVEFLVTQKGFK